MLRIPCELFRSEGFNEEWSQFQGKCSLSLTSSLLICHEEDQNQKIFELSFRVIQCVETTSASSFRIQLNQGSRYAIRLENDIMLKDIISHFQRMNVNVIVRSRGLKVDLFPNLEDPEVQEYITKLFFDQDFQQYVEEMSNFIDKMVDTIPHTK